MLEAIVNSYSEVIERDLDTVWFVGNGWEMSRSLSR